MAEGSDPLFVNWRTGEPMPVAEGLADGSVTNIKLAPMVQGTIKGRASGAGTGPPQDLTSAQATVILDAFVAAGAGHLKGLVPDPGVTVHTPPWLLGDDAAFHVARETLGAARTYYVRTDGSNSNTGLIDSAAGAFLTVQKAVDVVAALDCQNFSVVIQIRNVGTGIYTTPITLKAVLGGGFYTIQGEAGVVISTTGATAISLNGNLGVWSLQNFKVETTGGGRCILAVGPAIIFYTNIEFGACSDDHIVAAAGALIQCGGNYSISGGANAHFNSGRNATIICNNVTVTLSNTPVFLVAYCNANNGGGVQATGDTYAGTGASAGTSRFTATVNGWIDQAGGTFPGGAAGTTATGGQRV